MLNLLFYNYINGWCIIFTTTLLKKIDTNLLLTDTTVLLVKSN